MLGSIEDRRHRLKTLLKVEQKLGMIIRAINRSGKGKEAALMLICQAIPCIMHLENRVGEKMITVLLAMAADIFRKKTNTTTINTRFANNIQSMVNTRILGSIHCSKHWKVPFNEKGDCVSKVSFSNSKTRLFIDNLHVLIDKQSEYMEQDIICFQTKIDDFFTAYVEQSGVGKEGVTNYIHMLGSSHISYYMKTHGNLYKYSQQGWESLNEKLKLSFFNHTQHGGNFGIGSDENERSYLKPLFMFFQRELLWTSGLAGQHFSTEL